MLNDSTKSPTPQPSAPIAEPDRANESRLDDIHRYTMDLYTRPKISRWEYFMPVFCAVLAALLVWSALVYNWARWQIHSLAHDLGERWDQRDR